MSLVGLPALDRRLLHVFVAGPGEGEGIAIALPERGWILVDGCVAPGRPASRDPRVRFPLAAIHDRYGAPTDDPVELMLLTHPHVDHAHGFAELIEALEPRRVALTGVNDPLWSLADEAEAYESLRPRASTATQQSTGRVTLALRAIESYGAERGAILAACEGVTLHRASGLGVVACSPTGTWLQGRRDEGVLADDMVHRANWLSAVLSVELGRTRVVLGGDLPVRDGSGTVPTGWDAVLAKRPELVWHQGLKVPHHGSRDARHPDLIEARDQERAWCLTPFNSSGLPRTDADDGLDRLLRGNDRVLLTAPSRSRQMQRALDEHRVTPADLAKITGRPPPSPGFGPADTTYRAPRALDALDAVWCVGFDDAGRVAGRWRGQAAVEVVAARPA